MSDIDTTAGEDQAQAELESCLRAAAKVHDVGVYPVWLNTGDAPRLQVMFDLNRRRRRWLAIQSAFIGVGFMCLFMAIASVGFASRMFTCVAISAALGSLGCSRRSASAKLAAPTVDDVVRTAVSMAGGLGLSARRVDDGKWVVEWFRNQSS